MENRIAKIRKRTGKRLIWFKKIADAVEKAILAAGQGDGEVSKKVAERGGWIDESEI